MIRKGVYFSFVVTLGFLVLVAVVHAQFSPNPPAKMPDYKYQDEQDTSQAYPPYTPDYTPDYSPPYNPHNDNSSKNVDNGGLVGGVAGVAQQAIKSSADVGGLMGLLSVLAVIALFVFLCFLVYTMKPALMSLVEVEIDKRKSESELAKQRLEESKTQIEINKTLTDRNIAADTFNSEHAKKLGTIFDFQLNQAEWTVENAKLLGLRACTVLDCVVQRMAESDACRTDGQPPKPDERLIHEINEIRDHFERLKIPKVEEL